MSVKNEYLLYDIYLGVEKNNATCEWIMKETNNLIFIWFCKSQ